MALLSIPKDDLPVYKLLAEMPAEAFESFVSAVQKTEPTFSPDQFVEKIAPNVKGMSRDDIGQAVNVLCALYYLKDRRHISSSDLAQIAAKVLKKGGIESTELVTRLKKLLSFDDSLGITAKATDVLTEQERVFCGARILSDIRPIFAGNPKSASAAVIVHNLQIGFHNSGDGRHQEIYIALDTGDIEALKEVIARAEEKTKALTAILETSKVKYLEV